MSVNELLDSVNLNSKLSKWIIGTTITGLITLSGINLLNKPKDNTQFQNTVNELTIKVALLENKSKFVNSSIMLASTSLKQYIDSRLEFTIQNNDKGKDYILNVLNMSKQLSIEDKLMGSLENRSIVVNLKSVIEDTSSIEKVNINKIESKSGLIPRADTLIIKPVVKKKSLIKRILNIF